MTLTFEQAVLRPENVFLMVAVWTLLTAFAKLAPAVVQTKVYAHVLPYLPNLMCILALWVPGFALEAPVAVKLVLGWLLGDASGGVYKKVKTNLLGDDDRLSGGRPAEPPKATP